MDVNIRLSEFYPSIRPSIYIRIMKLAFAMEMWYLCTFLSLFCAKKDAHMCTLQMYVQQQRLYSGEKHLSLSAKLRILRDKRYWQEQERAEEQVGKSSLLLTMTSIISTMGALYTTIHIIEQAPLVLLLLLLLLLLPLLHTISIFWCNKCDGGLLYTT